MGFYGILWDLMGFNGIEPGLYGNHLRLGLLFDVVCG
jgi:hypothetical protein